MKRLAAVAFIFFSGLSAVAQSPSSLEVLRKTLTDEHTARLERIRTARLRSIPSVPGKTNIILTDIDRFGLPVYRMTFNAIAAKTTGADILQTPALSGLNIQGKDMLIGVWDAGTIKEHIEFDNRLVSVEGDDYNAHATHVTGILIAKGVDPAARGMAPDAKATTHYFANDVAIMAGLAAPGQESLLISNHSYGTTTGWVGGSSWSWSGNPNISSDEDHRFGLYNDRSMILDQITSLAPYYSIFWAAGNDRLDTGPGDGSHPADCNAGTGYDCIIPDATAKNIFTIGAVNKVPVYSSPTSVTMSTYSSWGPTDDGRIKPDLVAAGTDLYSTTSTGINEYEIMAGTSMATPNAAGSLALVQQLYHDLHGETFLRSATLKAIAIHTAREAGPFAGPDYSFGWGLVDVAAAGELVMNDNGSDKLIHELTIATAASIEIPVSPVAGKKVTATIVWTDPAAVPVGDVLDSSTPMLVNDLDLRIVDNTGVEQKPWVLDPLNPSRQALKGDNFRDNVEKIEFVAENKTYKVIVTGKGVLRNGSQNFSLVLSYEAISQPTTYYWIGNSGNWNDGAHWSAKSGGLAAMKIPTSADRTIFDENSFSIASVVSIVNATSISSLTWMSSSLSLIDLGQQTLAVGNELRVRSENPVFDNGTIQFKATSAGNASWSVDTHNDIDIEFTSGDWTWSGKASINKLILNSDVNFNSAKIDSKELTVTTNPVHLKLTSSVIAVSEKTILPGSQLTLTGTDSEFQFHGTNSEHIVSNLTFDGSVRAMGGMVVLNGKNNIKHLEVVATCNVNGVSDHFSELIMREGSELLLVSGATHEIDSIYIESSATNNTKLTSASNFAFISILKRHRYCFDYLTIKSVVIAEGAVNAGLHSTLLNASGWQRVDCDDILFADFDWKFACTHSLIEFKDKSNGDPSGWRWGMNGDGVEVTTSRSQVITDQNPTFIFNTPGTYPIFLGVNKNDLGDFVVKDIQVVKNPYPINTIMKGPNSMISEIAGERYQWFVNGKAIETATERHYPFSGQPGFFQVAAYNGGCNSISDPFQITGIEDDASEIVVSPNPATNRIHISGISAKAQLIAVDMLGRAFPLTAGTDQQYDINKMPSGLYVIRITDGNRNISQKLLIRNDQ